ncbi:SCL-interrupting locus protein like, partial [Dissostichus eleginoides]
PPPLVPREQCSVCGVTGSGARGWRRLYRVEVGGLSHHRCIKYKARDGRPVNQALQLHPDGHLSPSLQLTWISTLHTLTMCVSKLCWPAAEPQSDPSYRAS